MLKFGIDLTIWPWEYQSFNEILEFAQLAEKSGLDSVWMSDHLMYTVPNKGSLEAFSSLAAVAARTKNITIGTKVVCAPFRHPALLAKAGVTLDIISNGRFVLGIGAGWFKTEFDAYGFPFDKKVSVTRETVEIVKMLWEKPTVNYDGEFFKIKDAACLPKPVQKPHPPIWIGSSGPRMLKLTAEIGDGWVIPNPTVEEYRQKLETIRNHARKMGRNSEGIEAACYVYASLSTDSEEAWKTAEEQILPERRRAIGADLSLERLGEICFIGNPDDWIGRIEEYAKVGADHIIVKTVPTNHEKLRLYAEKVVPYFRNKE
ncbi:LLM class flavin-dependent oxidoreductase [Candidatus Bathyarchaeota archaeon]|nr:LLM class flavin-dependent oxidoreductase [Candidatus Bathyarchaeota archaeon]